MSAAGQAFRVQSYLPNNAAVPPPQTTHAGHAGHMAFGGAPQQQQQQQPQPQYHHSHTYHPQAQAQAHIASPPLSPRAGVQFGGYAPQQQQYGAPQVLPQQLNFPPSPTPATPRTPGIYAGSPSRGHGAAAQQTTAKVVSVVSAETGEAQNFRLCAGEHGDNVRAAVRGAFGVPESSSMAVRDQAGVNIVLGFPSVVEGGKYELFVRALAGAPQIPPQQAPQVQPAPQVAQVAQVPQVQQVPLQVVTQPLPINPSSTVDLPEVQQTSQPTVNVSLQQVHNVASEVPAPAAPQAAAGQTPAAHFHESVTTRQPTIDTGGALSTGPKNRKHSQANPMPGSSKALLIGASYAGQKEALPGSLDAVKSLRTWLGESGFHGQHLVLTDENPADAAHLPTRDNIVRALGWLIQGAKSGDSLFLLFAGHGVEVRHDNGTSYDEALLPVDFRATRPFQVVRQSDVQTHLVDKLPHGCKLTILCDCAHSGGMLDLPYSLRCKKDGNLEWREKLGFPEHEAQGDVVMMSGWRGDQTTDSAMNALSEAFVHAMAKDTNPTFEALVVALRVFLYQKTGPGYQVPRVSSNRRFSQTDVCILLIVWYKKLQKKIQRFYLAAEK